MKRRFPPELAMTGLVIFLYWLLFFVLAWMSAGCSELPHREVNGSSALFGAPPLPHDRSLPLRRFV